MAKVAGKKVEARRQPRSVVFSSRIASSGDSLYDSKFGWEQFWRSSRAQIEARGAFVARTDIADFYNQVRHDEILSQLEICGIPERLCQGFAGFLGAFGSGIGRGVPIGPHAGHLLAEVSLSRVDALLEASNIRFTRYIDDLHLFCETEKDAQLVLYDVADILYPEFGLALNRMKTSISPKDEFLVEARKRGREETPSEREEALLDAIRAVTDSDYDFASFEEVLDANPDAVTAEALEHLLDEELSQAKVDYPKLGWLLRRLGQVGAPGGVSYVLDNFEDFVPVIGDAARYLARAGSNWEGEWQEIGQKILDCTQTPIVEKSAYVESVLLGLFAEQKELNHIGDLLQRFGDSSPPVKREIILAARAAEATDWLHSVRKNAADLDPWAKRAFLDSTRILPDRQQEECIRAIQSEAMGADSILLGALLAERSPSGADAGYEPSGPAWAALRAQVIVDRQPFVEERLERLGDALEEGVRLGVGKDGLLICTWNLRNFGGGTFGFSDRLPESMLFIVRVLLACDLVAIQEVRDRAKVDHLLALLGPGWKKVICGEAPGREGNSEMSAFLYRTGKMESQGEVEQLVLGKRDRILGEHQFARPPFLANFQSARSKLTLCTAHTYFGATRGPKLQRRIAEIATLAKLTVRRAEKEQSTAILLGDLNVVGPDDDTMAPLKKHGIALPDRHLSPTNVRGDKFYTQIAFKPTHEGPRLRGAGAFPLFDHVFRASDAERYASEMKTTSAWDTSSRRKRNLDVEEFYPKWRTFQMSDHNPVWAHFAV